MITIDQHIGGKIGIVQYISARFEDALAVGIFPLEGVGADGTYGIRVAHIETGLVILFCKDDLVGRLGCLDDIVSRIEIGTASIGLNEGMLTAIDLITDFPLFLYK